MRKYQISIALTLSGVILLAIFTFFSWLATLEVEKQRESEESELSTLPSTSSSVKKRDLRTKDHSMLETYREARDSFIESFQELMILEQAKVLEDRRKYNRYHHSASSKDIGRRRRYADNNVTTVSSLNSNEEPSLKGIDLHSKKGIIASWNSSVEDDSKPFIIQLKYEWSNSTLNQSGTPVPLFIPAVSNTGDFITGQLDKLQSKLNAIISEMAANSSNVDPLIAILDDQQNNVVWILNGWLFLGTLILTITFMAIARVKLPRNRSSSLYNVIRQHGGQTARRRESMVQIEIDSCPSSSFSLASLTSLIDEY